MDETFQARLYRQVEKAPERKALAFIDSQGDHSWRSLGEVYGRAAATSQKLGELGVGRGDVCFIVLPSDHRCAALLLGALIRGAVPLLMAPPTIHVQGRYSSLTQVLEYVIRKIKPRVVFLPDVMSGIRKALEGTFQKSRFVFGPDALIQAGPSGISPVIPSATDVAGYQLTSGTTGFPRVCVWEQQKVVAALDCMSRAMNLNKEDVCLNWTPLYHDMGLVNNFYLCLTEGIPLAMLDPLDFVRKPALWLRGLSDTDSTLTWSPNFGFALAVDRVKSEEIDGISLKKVRAFWNAAERVHPDTISGFYERFNSFGLRRESLKTAYGLAENIGAATFGDLNFTMTIEQLDRAMLQVNGIAQPVAQLDKTQQGVPVVGVGRPCPGVEVKILGRNRRVLPEGQVGEIALKTPSVLNGYLGDSRATRRSLRGGLLCTGDLGYLRGKELFWVGRRRERITTLGKKLDPSDFEQILSKISGLRKGCFAAFGVDDATVGTQRIVVASEVKDITDGPYADLVSEIRSQIYLGLGVKVHEIILVPAGTLTKTSSGKRRHLHFQQLYQDGKLQALAISKKPSSRPEPEQHEPSQQAV